MGKKIYRIPKFKNVREAVAFWDTHDSTKYLSQTKLAHMSFPKPRHKVVIGVGEKEWQALKRIASLKGISYTSLIERFLSKNLAAYH